MWFCSCWLDGFQYSQFDLLKFRNKEELVEQEGNVDVLNPLSVKGLTEELQRKLKSKIDFTNCKVVMNSLDHTCIVTTRAPAAYWPVVYV